MSMRYQAGIVLPGYNALKVANAPTIGTATAGDTQVSVTFTAPACVGGGAISSYTVFSNCGAKTASGASSPLVVTGLTNGTAYTFKAIATNAYGPSYPSAASNSATPTVVTGQQAYTAGGTYSWVAPAGVTSVSIVAVGGGAGGSYTTFCACCGYFYPGGGGGGLSYKNNYSVTPGNSYTVKVGCGGPTQGCGGSSYFISSTTFLANGGKARAGQGGCPTSGGIGGTGGAGIGCGFGGCGGGNGGQGGNANSYGVASSGGGGGAGGYAGVGGAGASNGNTNGNGGFGGGGGGGGFSTSGSFGAWGGGGVGILGQGSSGSGGSGVRGGGGSCGTGGCLVRTGGAYGGGGGRESGGGVGAVRLIWPGTTRSFPSTNTGNL